MAALADTLAFYQEIVIDRLLDKYPTASVDAQLAAESRILAAVVMAHGAGGEFCGEEGESPGEMLSQAATALREIADSLASLNECGITTYGGGE